jgi:cell shape-determining protein MreC
LLPFLKSGNNQARQEMQSFSKLDEQEEGAVMSQEEYIASIIDLYKDTFETEADMEAFKLELLGASTDEHPQDVFEKLENENVSIKSDFKLESESENE